MRRTPTRSPVLVSLTAAPTVRARRLPLLAGNVFCNAIPAHPLPASPLKAQG
ncbi:hypothetical protein GCM10008959_21390 [Deinococcus seoulensis]|uniref:Uncharacterized protein n=2 Tax=Deinococcus TaxID=1298 RepID=A0ABQ2RR38_9DEIO|nr:MULTISPECIES: hypothetical protein [Deinococcus]GGR59408.1 hypothetical protein GCM10008959_21390 [Deinococcus seoulensis]GGS20232.1 hypothetical protein GCM10008961_09830 [Deinococcus knuensis]